MSTINLSAAQRDISVPQGATISIPFQFTRGGLPVDMTGGWDLRAQFRRSYDATDTVINATLANGMLAFTNAAQGMFVLKFAPANTSYAGNPKVLFSKDSPDTLDLVYDLDATSSTGDVYTICQGTLTINRAVTR